MLISHKKGKKAISCIKRPDNPDLTPLHVSANICLKAAINIFLHLTVLSCAAEAEINSLPPKKLWGQNSCPVRILQALSTPLGIYPSKLTHAKIIPVFKNEDESDLNYYRPISLLSVFNGIFEKLMYK